MISFVLFHQASKPSVNFNISEMVYLNDSNAYMSSDVAGPSISGSGDFFELSDRS